MRNVRIVVLVVGVLSGEVAMVIRHELAPISDQSVILPDTHDGADEQAWSVSHAQEPPNVPAVRDTTNVWVDVGVPGESTATI
jgi:hypothetical protein